MAKLPDKNRLLEEDFKDQIKWIGKLLYPLNNFMSQVYNALNKDLTFKDNFRGEIKEIEVTSADLPLKISHNLKYRVTGIMVLRAYWSPTKNTGSRVYLDGLNIDFDEDGGFLTINNIGGLPSDGKYYVLRLLLLTD